MSAATHDHEIIATLLVLLLSFVLLAGGIITVAAALWLRRQRAEGSEADAEAASRGQTRRVPPVGRAAPSVVKRPHCWLAIRNRNPLAVQNALALHNPIPCSWADGWSGSGRRRLFVSPPVSGWILVTGPALPEASEDVDACFRLLLDLSRKLGEVQFFESNPVLNHHAWARVVAGRVARAYAWAGRTLWNQGQMTRAEKELRLACHDYTEEPGRELSGGYGGDAANAEKVHVLASLWSLDPEEIDARFVEHEWGIAGELSRRY